MDYFYKLPLNTRIYLLSKLSYLSKTQCLHRLSSLIYKKNLFYHKPSHLRLLIKANKLARENLVYFKPFAKIFYEKWFYGRRFYTNKYTLDPRPESEVIIEKAKTLPFSSVLDLGTGTGCLALSIAKEISCGEVIAIDNNPHCLNVAKKNARRLGANVKFLRNNWLNSWEKPIDLLVSNPPYVEKITNEISQDPKYALIGNLGFYKRIAKKSHLFKHIILEINPDWREKILRLFPGKSFELLTNYVLYIKI